MYQACLPGQVWKEQSLGVASALRRPLSLLAPSLLEGTMASGLGWTQAYRAVHAANQALCPWGGSGGSKSKSSLGLR